MHTTRQITCTIAGETRALEAVYFEQGDGSRRLQVAGAVKAVIGAGTKTHRAVLGFIAWKPSHGEKCKIVDDTGDAWTMNADTYVLGRRARVVGWQDTATSQHVGSKAL
jgi:hypothetical protein